MIRFLFLLIVCPMILLPRAGHAEDPIDGIAYLYENYQDFKLCLGSSFGCHDITRVSLRGNNMRIWYTYKKGKLEGYVEPNGYYEGTYDTRSSSGEFLLRFYSDGQAYGSWAGMWIKDELSIVKR